MTKTSARTVRLTRDGAIVTVTIDREPKLNALDYATIDALMTAFDELEADDLVRAVIVTGAGQRAFSAGAKSRPWPRASPPAPSKRCGNSSSGASASPGGSRPFLRP